MNAAPFLIISCADCGQRNRVADEATPAGKRVVCGRCKSTLPLIEIDFDDDDVDDSDDDDFDGGAL